MAQKYPSFRQNAKYYLLEFCDRTSSHGFNFIAEPMRSIWEKVWWILIIGVAIYLNIAMVYQTYNKWRGSPVIVSFANEHTTIWQIPFPAITICPEIKSVKERYDYSDCVRKKQALVDLSPNETAKFEYMSLVCDPPKELLTTSFPTVNVTALDFLYEVLPNFFNSILAATWRGKNIPDENLSEMFSPMITSEGFCHTFNFMDRSDFFTDIVFNYKDTLSNRKKSAWSVENGYTADSDMNSYPSRTMIAGTKGGFTLMISVLGEDIDRLCGDSFKGFKVVLHPPDQIPRIKQKYFRLPLDHSVVVAIKPRMMTTSPDLKSYSPSTRRCYFNDEKELKFFKIYNQENCMLECLANFTLDSCGCVSMHSPRQNSTPICGAAIKPCLDKAKGIFTNNQENPKTKCDCLPSCHTLEYDTEISQSDWNWQPYIEILKNTKIWDSDLDNLSKKKAYLSKLVIYYKDMQFITSERNELYSTSEFWSNCGGLLGLFTGCTFISVCEFLYYLTIRLFFNIRMFGSRYWSGSKQLLKTRMRSGS